MAETHELIHELADRIINPTGYPDDPEESDRRAARRDSLEAHIHEAVVLGRSPLSIEERIADLEDTVGRLENDAVMDDDFADLTRDVSTLEDRVQDIENNIELED